MTEEEQLASALSVHIDAMLTGQPMPLEDDPKELRQLLALADQLAAVDLPPRPAFGRQLKQSLLSQHGGGNGGSARLGDMPSWVILGLVVLTGIIGIGTLTATLAVTLLLPQHNQLPTSTPQLPSPVTAPTPTVTPVPPTLTLTAETTATQGDTIQPPTASATDRLIPSTTPSPTFPFDLVGQPAGNNTDKSPDGNSDDNGDHHRQHDDSDDDDD